MSEAKYIVPEGMKEAGMKAIYEAHFTQFSYQVNAVLEAAIKWWAENPIVPTKEQAKDIAHAILHTNATYVGFSIEWQRRMFLAPEPELPEELDALMWESKPNSYNAMPDATHNRQILEAYELGKRSVQG